MVKVTNVGIIKTSIVSAFTIATALIWKDVIVEIIGKLVPPREELFYKIVVASLSTIVLILVLYIILKTENEAEYILKGFKRNKKYKIIRNKKK